MVDPSLEHPQALAAPGAIQSSLGALIAGVYALLTSLGVAWVVVRFSGWEARYPRSGAIFMGVTAGLVIAAGFGLAEAGARRSRSWGVAAWVGCGVLAVLGYHYVFAFVENGSDVPEATLSAVSRTLDRWEQVSRLVGASGLVLGPLVVVRRLKLSQPVLLLASWAGYAACAALVSFRWDPATLIQLLAVSLFPIALRIGDRHARAVLGVMGQPVLEPPPEQRLTPLRSLAARTGRRIGRDLRQLWVLLLPFEFVLLGLCLIEAGKGSLWTEGEYLGALVVVAAVRTPLEFDRARLALTGVISAWCLLRVEWVGWMGLVLLLAIVVGWRRRAVVWECVLGAGLALLASLFSDSYWFDPFWNLRDAYPGFPYTWLAAGGAAIALARYLTALSRLRYLALLVASGGSYVATRLLSLSIRGLQEPLVALWLWLLSDLEALAVGILGGLLATLALRTRAWAWVGVALVVVGAMGWALSRDAGGVERSHLERRAEEGDPAAMGQLAGWWAAVHDYNRAGSYVQLAAEGGDPEGMYRYALALQQGRLVPHDEVAARRWLRRARAAGHPLAGGHLGLLHRVHELFEQGRCESAVNLLQAEAWVAVARGEL